MIEILKQNKELWDLFTRKEEYNSLLLDQYDRFPYYLSRHRNILEPVVSKFLVENGLNVKYPDGKKFAICLTHDIDVVHLSKLSAMYGAAKSLMQHQIKSAFKTLFSNINKNWNPWWNFKDIMALEEKYGAYLAKSLLDKSYEVFGTYRRLSTPNFWCLQYLDIFESVDLIPADLVDAGSMVEAVKISEPDEIYHLAAQSFVGASFEQPIGTPSEEKIFKCNEKTI